MFQRPQLQTGEEERLPGSLQQGDWPRALRTDERSVARSCRSGRVVLQECTKGNCGRTHQTTMKGGQFRRGPTTLLRFNGRVRTPPQVLSTRSHVLLNFTVTPRPRVPALCLCVLPVRCRCGAPAWGAGACAACAFSISISLAQPKKAVKLPALCVARLLWIL